MSPSPERTQCSLEGTAQPSRSEPRCSANLAAEGSIQPAQAFGRGLDALKLTALCALPLVFLPALAEDRALPRRALVGLIAFGALSMRLWSGRQKVHRALRLPAALAAVALLLACLNARSFGRSFYGLYRGHAGALCYLAYLALLLTAPPPPWMRRYAIALAGVGALQAGGAWLQYLGGEAPTGTMGHLMFLAALTMLAAITSAGLWLDAKRGWTRGLAALTSLLCTSATVITGRRGPLLALFAGMVLLLALRPQRRKLLVLGIGAALLSATLALTTQLPTQHRSRPIERLAALLGKAQPSTESDTIQQRKRFYALAVHKAMERPLLGWGFGSFRDMYAQQALNGTKRFETDVHNLPLTVLLSAGVLGLLALGWLFGGWVRTAQKFARSSGVAAATVAAPLAYLLHLMFNFDQPGAGAWAIALAAFPAAGAQRPQALKRPAKTAGLALLSATLGAAYLLQVAADLSMGIGLGQEAKGRPAQSIRWYRQGVALAPYECMYTLKLVTALSREAHPPGDRRRLLEACLKREPDNAFLHYHLALSWDESGAAAQQHLARACALAPNEPMFHQRYARTLAMSGNLDGALRRIDHALTLQPDLLQENKQAGLHNDRGNILLMMGRPKEAQKSYLEALRRAPGTALFQENLARAAQSARSPSNKKTRP